MSIVNMTSLVASPFSHKLATTFQYYAYDVWDIQGDDRISHYPLMGGGPWTTLAIIGVYLYFVKVYGPQFMKHRKPFFLKDVMVCYNFVMVAVSWFMFYEGSRFLNYGLDCWRFKALDYSLEDSATRKFLFVCWLFYYSKIIELADTVFFVLRKKDNQVTTLHVIHHSVVPLSVWFGLKFAPGGANAWFPLMNSLVHTFMYSYYGLCALGPGLSLYPHLRKCKKYLTALQMGQFCLAIVHCLSALLMPNRSFPKSFLFLNLGNAVLFLGLFLNFYRISYSRKAILNNGNGNNNNNVNSASPRDAKAESRLG